MNLPCGQIIKEFESTKKHIKFFKTYPQGGNAGLSLREVAFPAS